ncbi:MAG: O-antigen ligase family protein [Saprospiraceae bacterium]|nr:O-antigen ligase family protein [Saprospiraceae bacterium]
MIDWLYPFRTPQRLMYGSAWLLVGSMVLSPFLLSVSMWGLVAAAGWHTAEQLLKNGEVSTLKSASTWLKALVRSFQHLFQQPALALMTLLLLVPAVSAFWSDDLAYWLRVTRVRLPFLVLPWAFANLPRLDQRAYREVLYLLVWWMVLLCIGVGINFLLHFDAILTGLGKGQPVPVPRQHVRFSLVVATAIISGIWLWRQRFFVRYAWERNALAAATGFLFIFIHILSVRSGLVVLYAALVFTVVRYVWQTKKWTVGLLTLASLVVVLWTAVENIPSLRTRLAYMKYDWERYKAKEGEAYSDSERLTSLEVGWKIWRENPALGCGAGDLLNEVKRITVAEHPDYAKSPKLPHNQWLHIMASTGLFGLVCSLFGIFAALFTRRKGSRYLFLTFQLMAFITFLFECTIENAIGVAWFLFYTLWFLRLERQ